jgi:hypothetical protein
MRDSSRVEPVVYREEVLTIMGVLGDIRLELERTCRTLGGDNGEEEEERTPEEIAQAREWRAQSDANLRGLRELVDRGWAELEERRRREAAASS